MNKLDGTFDYSKFFMGLAVAVVFVLQQLHSMKLEDVANVVVPRSEIQATNATMVNHVKENYMTREEIIDEIDKLKLLMKDIK